ncbi:hypothetical protein [Oceanithermus sp.]
MPVLKEPKDGKKYVGFRTPALPAGGYEIGKLWQRRAFNGSLRLQH